MPSETNKLLKNLEHLGQLSCGNFKTLGGTAYIACADNLSSLSCFVFSDFRTFSFLHFSRHSEEDCTEDFHPSGLETLVAQL